MQVFLRDRFAASTVPVRQIVGSAELDQQLTHDIPAVFSPAEPKRGKKEAMRLLNIGGACLRVSPLRHFYLGSSLLRLSMPSLRIP